jgi:methionyl-tRNA synthetase
MTEKKPFYLTTTLPYVNAAPHIGFALEIVQADVIARYKRLMGYEVFFNFGSDEHGQKIFQKAQESGQTTQEYVDEYASKFVALKEQLNLTYDTFIRTTDPHHKAAAQEMWRLCKAKGDIYKKNYQVKYCVGCELEKTDSELVNGRCPIHPNMEIEIRDEENYFFRLSAYQDRLRTLYERTDFLVPDYRLNEMRALVERGLEDFSISRLKSKMSWGVEVPDDTEHVMYVWFDALVNYISTLGWPEDTEKFSRFWNGTRDCIQLAGKDQVRQQSAMWQAMLMSAGLPLSGQILIHGFITSGGEKMSKSLGNVIEPMSLVAEYGTDALRYFLLRHIHPTEDSDFTMEKFKEVYNADLANGLGNLAARIMKLAETHLSKEDCSTIQFKDVISKRNVSFLKSTSLPDMNISFDYEYELNNYHFNEALGLIWVLIQNVDVKITTTAPFKVVKTDPQTAKKIITDLKKDLFEIALMLEPFMPDTSEKIKAAIIENKKPENLFVRKD